MIFRISLETDLIITIRALEIKPEDLDPQIGFLITDFHPHIEFRADIEIVCAYIAP